MPLFPKTKVLLDFFQKIAGSRGGAPDALRTASRSEAFRAQPAEGGLLARDERGTLYPVKRFFRVNCREAARGGFLQVKKPPVKHTIVDTLQNRHLFAEMLDFLFVKININIPKSKNAEENPLRFFISLIWFKPAR